MKQALIVVGEKILSLLYKYTLENYEFETYSVHDLSLLRDSPEIFCQYDLAIVDYNLLEKFRQICPDIPIIVPKPVPERVNLNDFQGIVGMFEYPITPRGIIETVRTIINPL